MDWQYRRHDRVVDPGGNYIQERGSTSKAGRLLCSHRTRVGGVWVGNKLWTEINQDTPLARATAKRYCDEAIEPLVRLGEIKDVEVVVGDPVGQKGMGILVLFTDVAAGTRSTITLPAWGTV